MEQQPNDRIQFYIVDPGEFVVESLVDVAYLWRELIRFGETYPGAVPIFRTGDGNPEG